RDVRRHHVLVPQDLRPDDERAAGEDPLRPDVRLLQPGVLPHALPGRGGDDATDLQPHPVRVPPAHAAHEPLHVGVRPHPGRLSGLLHRELPLEPGQGSEGRPQSVAGQHAGLDRSLAAAPPQLGPDAAGRLPGSVRVQLARGDRGLSAAGSPPGDSRIIRARPLRGQALTSRPGLPGPAIAASRSQRLTPHGLAMVTAGATLVLVVAGGLVTNTGAALAVPDWPTTFGHNMFLFPWSGMVGGIFYEHSHRLLGALVGLL